MSFNFNGPSFRPMIQESQSMQNNGGGGNTGYFERGKKKKNNKDINVFGGDDEKDAFIPSSDEAEILEENGLLDKLAQKAKGFVEKIKENSHENSAGKNPFKDGED